MGRQITHQPDENGIMRQIVSPAKLREILDRDGDDYSRPDHFGPKDEWDVAEETTERFEDRLNRIAALAWGDFS
jgi:hypothetical protein